MGNTAIPSSLGSTITGAISTLNQNQNDLWSFIKGSNKGSSVNIPNANWKELVIYCSGGAGAINVGYTFYLTRELFNNVRQIAGTNNIVLREGQGMGGSYEYLAIEINSSNTISVTEYGWAGGSGSSYCQLFVCYR